MRRPPHRLTNPRAHPRRRYDGSDVLGALLTTASVSPVSERGASTRRRSIMLVLMCTVFGAAAQMLIKAGASSLPHLSGVIPNLMAMAVNSRLLAGYSLYGISTILLIIALRHGELSLLYPVIALTYVWVAILSVLVFHEYMNPLRLGGVAVIVVGVAILGQEKS
jgi:drug/metabolite transporter (DMT)-like permease